MNNADNFLDSLGSKAPVIEEEFEIKTRIKRDKWTRKEVFE